MINRREFVATIIRPAVAATTLAVLEPAGVRRSLAAISNHDGQPAEVAKDETFWFEVQQAFTVDRSLVNLNNGGVSPSPAIVQDAMKRHLDYSNSH